LNFPIKAARLILEKLMSSKLKEGFFGKVLSENWNSSAIF